MLNSTPPYGNILLIDDDPFLIRTYVMKFEKRGYSVHAVLSVDDALQLLRANNNFDAILFDIIMPGKTGFSLLESIQNEKLQGHSALIALTNQTDPEEERRAFGLGTEKYIVKATMIPSEVVNTVEEVIRSRPR